MYLDKVLILRHRFFTRSKVDPTKFVWNLRKFRKLILLTLWLGFHCVEQSLPNEAIPNACKRLPKGEVEVALAEGIKPNKSVDHQSLQHVFKMR